MTIEFEDKFTMSREIEPALKLHACGSGAFWCLLANLWAGVPGL